MLIERSNTKKRSMPRAASGSSILEAVAGVILLAAALAVCFDFVLLFVGYQINSAVCREAARTASMTVPSRLDRDGKLTDHSPLFQSADGVLKKRGQFENSWISRPVLTEVSVEGLRLNESKHFGSGIDGCVAVSSTTTVSLPVLVGNLIPSTVTMQSSFCYPITAVMDPPR
jgi:hypothetical protein